MRARTLLRIFSLATAVLIMIAIFYMSAQSGEESSSLSGSLTGSVLDKTEDGFSELDDAEKSEIIESVGKYVRKAAHFAEYFVLCGALTVFAFTFDIKRIPACGFSIALATVYAASDEIHQLFVPGRCGLFTDVLIDTAGAIFGAVFVLLICAVFKIPVKKKQKQSEKIA